MKKKNNSLILLLTLSFLCENVPCSAKELDKDSPCAPNSKKVSYKNILFSTCKKNGEEERTIGQTIHYLKSEVDSLQSIVKALETRIEEYKETLNNTTDYITSLTTRILTASTVVGTVIFGGLYYLKKCMQEIKNLRNELRDQMQSPQHDKKQLKDSNEKSKISGISSMIKIIDKAGAVLDSMRIKSGMLPSFFSGKVSNQIFPTKLLQEKEKEDDWLNTQTFKTPEAKLLKVNPSVRLKSLVSSENLSKTQDIRGKLKETATSENLFLQDQLETNQSIFDNPLTDQEDQEDQIQMKKKDKKKKSKKK